MNAMDENHFDRLSDDILRSIFNKVLDAKSLCRCLCVCKRFASLVPQTDAVSLTLPPCNSLPPPPPHPASPLNFLKIFINKFITKPLQYLHHILLPNSSSITRNPEQNSNHYHSLDKVLRNFSRVKFLHIQLPSHGEDLGSRGSDSLLKWKANFGSQLESCVVLGAASFQRKKISLDDGDDDDIGIGKAEQEQCENEQEQSGSGSLLFSNDELKLRVVWTISCLIASSARHYLLKQIVVDRPMLRSVVITDANKQGRLSVIDDRIVDMWRSCVNPSVTLEESESESERVRVPAVKMKLWYVPELELPESGWVMKGATLVVIRAVDHGVGSDGDLDLLEGGFDGEDEEKVVLGEAVREIMKMKKKKVYTMEMDSI